MALSTADQTSFLDSLLTKPRVPPWQRLESSNIIFGIHAILIS